MLRSAAVFAITVCVVSALWVASGAAQTSPPETPTVTVVVSGGDEDGSSIWDAVLPLIGAGVGGGAAIGASAVTRAGQSRQAEEDRAQARHEKQLERVKALGASARNAVAKYRVFLLAVRGHAEPIGDWDSESPELSKTRDDAQSAVMDLMASAPLVADGELRNMAYRLAEEVARALEATAADRIDEYTKKVRGTMNELTKAIERAFRADPERRDKVA